VSEAEVKALLDSGAYSNCVSLAWLEKQGLTQDLQPVNGEYIQLGGTNKQLLMVCRENRDLMVSREAQILFFYLLQFSLKGVHEVQQQALESDNAYSICFKHDVCDFCGGLFDFREQR